MRNIPENEIHQRVNDALELVSLKPIAERSVVDLSGGEKQRVAFARSIAPKPDLLMLDEPMGSLDRSLRDQLINELHTMINKMDIPVIYVTHDQEEAFSIADRILILNRGRIVQSGSPQYLYTNPKDLWIASFFGLNNILEGTICSLDPNVVETEIGKMIFSCNDKTFSIGDVVDMVILSNALKTEGDNKNKNLFSGQIIDNLFKGNNYEIRIRIEDQLEFSFLVPSGYSKGTQLDFFLDSDSILCFDRKH
jgi:ABC-type Fe3+/spermidine/putrescine transport system ATPase subunit